MYLLDTNIVVFLFKGQFELDKKMDMAGHQNCYISEITLAELKYGAEKSNRRELRHRQIDEFVERIRILPIVRVLDFYARERTRLEKIGMRLDDFDLLIGSTAVVYGLIMVTNNTNHLKRLDGIQLRDWTISAP